MKKTILCIVLALAVCRGTAFAASPDLAGAGLTPDRTFYFLKSWTESVRTFFTLGEERKAQQYLHLSEVRLAEYRAMIEKGKTDIAQRTLERYNTQLNRSFSAADKAKQGGKDVSALVLRLGENALRHREVLLGVLEKAPESARAGIENAVEASQQGLVNALQAVTGEKKEEMLQAAEETRGRIQSALNALKEKLPEAAEKSTEKIEAETREAEGAEASAASPGGLPQATPSGVLQMPALSPKASPVKTLSPSANPAKPPSTLPEPEASSGPHDAFAKCLTAKGVKIYGASWCPHCVNQKNMFGASWRYVQYVECAVQGGGQAPACAEAGISGYPTWVFPGGERASGELTFEALASRSGCAL